MGSQNKSAEYLLYQFFAVIYAVIVIVSFSAFELLTANRSEVLITIGILSLLPTYSAIQAMCLRGDNDFHAWMTSGFSAIVHAGYSIIVAIGILLILEHWTWFLLLALPPIVYYLIYRLNHKDEFSD